MIFDPDGFRYFLFHRPSKIEFDNILCDVELANNVSFFPFHLFQVIVHALHCEIIGTSIPTRNSCVMRVALHLSWACRAFHDSDPRPKHYGGASVHDVASAKRAGLQVLFGVHWKFFFEWSGRFLIPSATSPGLQLGAQVASLRCPIFRWSKGCVSHFRFH